MKTIGARFLILGVMLGGLLFLCNPDPLFALSHDTYPHFVQGGACSAHMVSPQSIGNSPQTFTLCKGGSGATHWQADIRNLSNVTVCSFPYTAVTSPQTFPCNIAANGYYKGYVYWWVGDSIMMQHIDQYFRKP